MQPPCPRRKGSASPRPPRRGCSWPAAPRPPRPAAACTPRPHTRGAANLASPARRVHPAGLAAAAAAAPPTAPPLRGWRAAASSAAAGPCGRGRTTGHTRAPLASVAGSAQKKKERVSTGCMRSAERLSAMGVRWVLQDGWALAATWVCAGGVARTSRPAWKQLRH